MAKLGGYGTTVGDAGLGGGRDFIDSHDTLSAGTVSQVKIYLGTVDSGSNLKFKVFRLNGSNLDFVGQSESISYTTLTSNAINTINLSTTIACQTGDYLAVTLATGSAVLRVQTGVSGANIYYKDGDITSGSTATSSFSTGAWALEAEFWDTSASAPTVTTSAATSIGQTTATGNGNVTADGGATVTDRGVCWGTSANPTISGNHSHAASGGTGAFTADITGLSAGTHYHYRAWATNSVGTSYGVDTEFDSASSSGTIAVSSPGAYQTYQRNGSGQADIAISGTYTGTPTSIEAAFSGGSYATIVASPTGGTFSGTLSAQSAGQGTLTVRFSNDTGVVATKASVSIGDVFVCIGDSIAQGRVTNNQSYSGTLKATMYKSGWAECADPTNAGGNGSFWPLVATKVLADQTGVPVGVINVGSGSTRVGGASATWPKGQAEYSAMASAITAAAIGGSPKAFLCHLGANEAVLASTISQATMNAAIDQLASDLVTDYPGTKLVFAQLGEVTTGTPPDRRAALDNIRNAIRQAWQDNATVKAGPVLYDLATDDGVHYTTDVQGAKVAQRWWLALKEALFSGSAGSGRGPTLVSAKANAARDLVVLAFSVPTTPLLPQTGVAAFRVMGNGSVATISAATRIDTTRIALSLSAAATEPLTVSLGSQNDGAGATVPTDSSTDHLPAEAFAGESVTVEGAGGSAVDLPDMMTIGA